MQQTQRNLLEKLKKNLIQLNNGYLTKRKVFLDKDFVINQYVLDDQLEKKKKQPKFVKDMELQPYKYVAFGNKGMPEFIEDHMAMKIW